jgi:putative nucleotidyltransferase with HDIG domain
MADRRGIALSELIGALSSALDVAEGEPPGHAKRSCLIGMRLADQIELVGEARSDLFYALLLKDAGCSANAAHMAALFGADDQVAKRTSKLVDWSRPLSALRWSVRTVAPDGSLKDRLDRLRAIRDEGEVTKSLMLARCHRGAEIALKLGFSEATAGGIRALDEHWDGRGQPYGLSGAEIPLTARILCLAQTVEVFQSSRGVESACHVAVKRRGQWFDPGLVDALAAFRHDQGFWDSLTEPDVSTVEPADRVMTADENRLDLVVDGFAAVIDAKSPWTHHHSERVAAISTGMAKVLGLDEAAVRELRRAALLHDIGKLSISNRVLDKPGPLTESERVRLEEHPLLGERILGRVPEFRSLAAVASAHHERLDGGGYPRGLAADELTVPMRVLAVADVYEALISERPYRPAHTPARALEMIRAEVPLRLDADALEALMALLDESDTRFTGHPSSARRA